MCEGDTEEERELVTRNNSNNEGGSVNVLVCASECMCVSWNIESNEIDTSNGNDGTVKWQVASVHSINTIEIFSRNKRGERKRVTGCSKGERKLIN